MMLSINDYTIKVLNIRINIFPCQYQHYINVEGQVAYWNRVK